MPEPRTRRRRGPIDPEGPEYVPEDVYPDDPTLYDEGPPPDPSPPPYDEPEIVVEIDSDVPAEGVPDEEEVYEEDTQDDTWVEPELPPEDPDGE